MGLAERETKPAEAAKAAAGQGGAGDRAARAVAGGTVREPPAAGIVYLGERGALVLMIGLGLLKKSSEAS